MTVGLIQGTVHSLRRTVRSGKTGADIARIFMNIPGASDRMELQEIGNRRESPSVESKEWC